jgi:alpha-galactosidase
MAGSLNLDNGTLKLALDVSGGVCRIARTSWVRTGGAVASQESGAGLAMPLEGDDPGAWTPLDDDVFLGAVAAQTLAGGIEASRWVGLARTGSSFRTQVRMSNTGDTPRRIPWFPVWSAALEIDGGADRVRWWQALSFTPQERTLAGAEPWTLRSRLHSSDTKESEDGVNPYWVVVGDDCSLYFSLDWCGGWEAQLQPMGSGIALDVRLPENETQLVLNPGETIAGPVLTVTATAESGERESRANWMRQRAALARALYGGPVPGYPFTYNNWYTTHFDVTGDFLRRQVAAMAPYNFDYFIVDAGWYKGCGDWVPDLAKFREGEFESILASSVDRGVPAGIWTCPQYLQADADDLPAEVDQPDEYQGFIDGHLLDLTGMGFTEFLLDHVENLRQRYHADWWKYDQLLFTADTRHGIMKNVVAFQDALRAVRAAHPDLMIENCQSGGRMINEFTVLATQSQWIRDGGNTGPAHARSNLFEVLGAVEFLPPWACNRWTNNPDLNAEDDDEFTRMYCRCAMPGTWGLVADLDSIGSRQREIIAREVAHYRRLSALKEDYLYDLRYPEDGRAAAGVTFYTSAGDQAGVLLYRLDAEGAFDAAVPLEGLQPDARYRIEDVDADFTTELPGFLLTAQGLLVSFDEKRLSALVFVQAVD